ncbi:hypothetical protein [Pseudomonas gessardii]|uniref:hypothetical protein n=1 Tax=Pseudomonas gessardii TaxID=78544 RepID=UPI0018D91128|nr:hypothetical protein [Pseudomonas gessardii]MBH3423364.1 hypothetical protein [Pseudomonas gessardii]
MDIRAFTAMGIIQQAISNQVSTLHTTTPDSAQNSQKPRAERSVPDTLQPAALKGPDSATRPTAATGRPAGDRRTAEEIINANPTLKNLEMRQSIYRGGPESRPLPDAYKQGIYKRTGDWTTANKNPDARADAAYNAARLFNFIDSKNAHAVVASQHNDGFLSGYLGNEQVVRCEQIGLPFRGQSIRKDSEHALLTKFIEHGYSSLEFKGEQQIHTRPTHPTGRPRGDQRSAEDIMRDNPLVSKTLSNLNKTPHFKEFSQDYQKHTGDWSKNNINPETRADANYNLASIANYLHKITIDRPNAELRSELILSEGKLIHKEELLLSVLKNGYHVLRPR